MSDQRRYRLRPNSVGLTATQLVLVGLAVVVALVGLVMVIQGAGLGAALMGLAGVAISAVTIVALSGSQKS
ncbi:MAG: hypothetical protein ACRYF3_11225 [Janthinobacterium lividum]